MILPIYIYNNNLLTTPGNRVEKDDYNIEDITSSMFETMYAASGIGLAAHQVGIPIKLFVIDITHYSAADENLNDFKKVFINSEILEEDGGEEIIQEGCLSFPGIHLDVKRKTKIHLKYLDENFIEHQEWFEGLAARCIQHEHDHTNGILFTKRTPALRLRLMNSKLKQIIKRNFSTNYKYKL